MCADFNALLGLAEEHTIHVRDRTIALEHIAFWLTHAELLYSVYRPLKGMINILINNNSGISLCIDTMDTFTQWTNV